MSIYDKLDLHAATITTWLEQQAANARFNGGDFPGQSPTRRALRHLYVAKLERLEDILDWWGSVDRQALVGRYGVLGLQNELDPIIAGDRPLDWGLQFVSGVAA